MILEAGAHGVVRVSGVVALVAGAIAADPLPVRGLVPLVVGVACCTEVAPGETKSDLPLRVRMPPSRAAKESSSSLDDSDCLDMLIIKQQGW